MRGVSHRLILGLIGCLMASCNGVSKSSTDTGAEDLLPPDGEVDTGHEDSESPSITIRSEFHYGGWGNEVPSCNIEISLTEPADPDTLPEPSDTGEATAPQVIEIPDDPGTCVLSSFVQDTGAPDEPYTPEPIAASPYAYLYGEEEDFVLVVDDAQLEMGKAVYTMESCSYENFPFEAVFDFELPAKTGGFGDLYIQDLVYVGPNLAVYEPEVAEDDQFLAFGQDDNLYAEWAVLGEAPTFGDEQAIFSSTVVVRNTRSSDEFLFEALACVPETNTSSFTFGPDQWYALVPNHSTVKVPNYSTFQIDAQYHRPTFENAKANIDLMPSVVSFSGMFHLYSASADL
jgi:hypothetical protein